MEFSEVMKQARRMCAAYTAGDDCDICPIWYDGCMLSPCRKSELDAHWLEESIKAWAKANPEPVYPSWSDGWKQIFPDAMLQPCPALFGAKYKNTACASVLCKRCRERIIPAEVAEKLGIKPIVKGEKQ